MQTPGKLGADRRAARVQGQFWDVLSESLELSSPDGRVQKPLLVRGQKPKGLREKKRLHATRVFPLLQTPQMRLIEKLIETSRIKARVFT